MNLQHGAYHPALNGDHQHLLGGENPWLPCQVDPQTDGKVPLPPLLSVFGGRYSENVSQNSGNSFSNRGPYTGTFPNFMPVQCEKISKKRNVSEKGRSPNVNVAFKKLRTLIPTEPVDRRLSKVETLRLAVSYIRHLDQTLNCDITEEQPCLAGSQGNGEIAGNSICTFCMTRRRKNQTM